MSLVVVTAEQAWEMPQFDMSDEDASRLVSTVVALHARLEAAEARERRVRALFSGGPDTPCRTTWHQDADWMPAVECVEVPMADLRTILDGEGNQ